MEGWSGGIENAGTRPHVEPEEALSPLIRRKMEASDSDWKLPFRIRLAGRVVGDRVLPSSLSVVFL